MSITDMSEMENLVGGVVDCFEEKMKIVFEEEPEIFKTRFANGEVKIHSTEQEWSSQVANCRLDLVAAIDELIEKFEVKLHNGEYHR